MVRLSPVCVLFCVCKAEIQEPSSCRGWVVGKNCGERCIDVECHLKSNRREPVIGLEGVYYRRSFFLEVAKNGGEP